MYKLTMKSGITRWKELPLYPEENWKEICISYTPTLSPDRSSDSIYLPNPFSPVLRKVKTKSGQLRDGRESSSVSYNQYLPQSSEVLSGLWYNISTQLHDDASCCLSSNGDVEIYFWVGPMKEKRN